MGKKLGYMPATIMGLKNIPRYDHVNDCYYHDVQIFSSLGERSLTFPVLEKEITEDLKGDIIEYSKVKKSQNLSTYEKIVVKEGLEHNMEIEEIIDKLRWSEYDMELVNKISTVCHTQSYEYRNDVDEAEILIFEDQLLAIGSVSKDKWFDINSQDIKTEAEIREKYIPKKRFFMAACF